VSPSFSDLTLPCRAHQDSCLRWPVLARSCLSFGWGGWETKYLFRNSRRSVRGDTGIESLAIGNRSSPHTRARMYDGIVPDPQAVARAFQLCPCISRQGACGAVLQWLLQRYFMATVPLPPAASRTFSASLGVSRCMPCVRVAHGEAAGFDALRESTRTTSITTCGRHIRLRTRHFAMWCVVISWCGLHIVVWCTLTYKYACARCLLVLVPVRSLTRTKRAILCGYKTTTSWYSLLFCVPSCTRLASGGFYTHPFHRPKFTACYLSGKRCVLCWGWVVAPVWVLTQQCVCGFVSPQILRSVLMADVVGFHTYDYARKCVCMWYHVLPARGGPCWHGLHVLPVAVCLRFLRRGASVGSHLIGAQAIFCLHAPEYWGLRFDHLESSNVGALRPRLCSLLVLIPSTSSSELAGAVSQCSCCFLFVNALTSAHVFCCCFCVACCLPVECRCSVAKRQPTQTRLAELRAEFRGKRVLLGVDRLDYIKVRRGWPIALHLSTPLDDMGCAFVFDTPGHSAQTIGNGGPVANPRKVARPSGVHSDRCAVSNKGALVPEVVTQGGCWILWASTMLVPCCMFLRLVVVGAR